MFLCWLFTAIAFVPPWTGGARGVDRSGVEPGQLPTPPNPEPCRQNRR